MEENLPNREYGYWMTFFMEEGFPEDRIDRRTALIVQSVVNMSGKSLKELKTLADFLPDLWDERKEKAAVKVNKTIEDQEEDFNAFKNKYLNAQKR